MARRPLIEITAPRIVAAGSFAVVAVFFAVAVVGFLKGGLEASSDFRSMAKWPAYELLASTFAILLPLLQGVQRVLGRMNLSWRARWIAIAVLWVPLFVIAWAICGSVFGTAWFLIGFLVFTLVHFVSFECEEVRMRVLGSAPRPLLRSVRRFAKCYGLAMVAAALALFVVFLPMDVMGIFIESDPRMEFMSVAIGMFYFLLLGVTELIDLEGMVERFTARRHEEKRRNLEWIERSILGQEQVVEEHPSPPPGVGRFFRPEDLASGELPVEELRNEGFEEWVEELPVNNATQKRIQYWDRKLVRFGKPFRTVRRDRTICLVGSVLSGVVMVLCLVVALHPASFKKKHERNARFRAATHTEQSDRDAFKLLSGFAFVLGAGLGIAYWLQLEDKIGKPFATVDCYHGMVTAKTGARAKIRHCSLTVEKRGTQSIHSTVPKPNQSLTEVWALVATTVHHAADAAKIVLLDVLNRRDAEILRLELLPYGFADPEPAAAAKAPRELVIE